MNFSFKREPIWMVVLSLAPAGLALLILAIVLMARAVR